MKLARTSLTLVLFLALPRPVLACAACFGASDSDMAKGMNMGIFALLAVIVVVLAAIASFFIYLARRANGHPSENISTITYKQTS